MPEIAKKSAQFPWNCQWARQPEQIVGIRVDPSASWVCVRPRRGRLTVACAPPSVTEEECTECPFWEPDHQPEGEGGRGRD